VLIVRPFGGISPLSGTVIVKRTLLQMNILWMLALGVGTTTCPDTLPQPHDAPALVAALQARGLPYAHYFASVAVVETGWDFRQGVGVHNNLFGMRSRPGYPATPHGYAVYAHRLQAIEDLAVWVAQDPPRADEPAEAFLRRREWNPYPGYYAYVAQVDPQQPARTRAEQHLRAALGAQACALLPSLAPPSGQLPQRAEAPAPRPLCPAAHTHLLPAVPTPARPPALHLGFGAPAAPTRATAEGIRRAPLRPRQPTQACTRPLAARAPRLRTRLLWA
jgi:hypothetical protein